MRKLEGEIELDPHATGASVIRLSEDTATAVRDQLFVRIAPGPDAPLLGVRESTQWADEIMLTGSSAVCCLQRVHDGAITEYRGFYFDASRRINFYSAAHAYAALIEVGQLELVYPPDSGVHRRNCRHQDPAVINASRLSSGNDVHASREDRGRG